MKRREGSEPSWARTGFLAGLTIAALIWSFGNAGHWYRDDLPYVGVLAIAALTFAGSFIGVPGDAQEVTPPERERELVSQ